MLTGLGSFKHARGGVCIVALCKGQDMGREFYAFVAIEPQNYRYFKRRYRENETSNFKPYGFELLRGWGAEPSREVLEYIQLKHGIEFNVSEGFLSRLVTNFETAARPLTRDWFAQTAAQL